MDVCVSPKVWGQTLGAPKRSFRDPKWAFVCPQRSGAKLCGRKNCLFEILDGRLFDPKGLGANVSGHRKGLEYAAKDYAQAPNGPLVMGQWARCPWADVPLGPWANGSLANGPMPQWVAGHGPCANGLWATRPWADVPWANGPMHGPWANGPINGPWANGPYVPTGAMGQRAIGQWVIGQWAVARMGQ